jgi:rod shape-determining protein MreC
MIIPILILGAVFFLLFSKSVRGIELLQRPFAAAGSSISSWVFWSKSASIISSTDLEELYASRDSLAVDQVKYHELLDRNLQLEALLSYTERSASTSVTASIISRSLEASHRFIIDVGSASGIAIGQAVVVGDGILIGKVSSVSEFTSTVTALPHKESAVASSIFNETRTIGIVEGGKGNLLTMSFIPDSERLKQNDLVVTSGLEDGIPSGLIVGIINAVITNDHSPFQQAIVEPMTDSRRQHVVLVVIPETL